jgi:hypothetical protein
MVLVEFLNFGQLRQVFVASGAGDAFRVERNYSERANRRE